MSMYDYRFVNIGFKSKFLSMRPEPEQDYHEVIEEYGSRGWRLVQIFTASLPTPSGHSMVTSLELIFEKERTAENAKGLFDE